MLGRRVRAVVGLAVFLGFLSIAGFGAAVALTPLPPPTNPQATVLLDRNGDPIESLYTQNRVDVPDIELPAHLLNAVVAIEDDRFYRHVGIDPLGVSRAFVRNVTSRRVVEGGSTLTQQLAKNLYLTPERTVGRKVREAVLTMKLERSYSKTEILGLYLNTIYLGQGAYGVEVASQQYFGKSARDLTLAEAALIASLPRAPEYYNPVNNPEAAVQRRNLVLGRMAAQGYITAEEAEAAQREPAPAPPLGRTADQAAPYFIDLVSRWLQERRPDIAGGLYKEGYVVHTTLDRSMQQAAEETTAASYPPGAGSKPGVPQVSLVAIDPRTGEIRAAVGGRDRRVERNRMLEPQQPGSAFKPFVYAAALESRGYTVIDTQLDAPADFPGATPGKPWRPENYGRRYSHKPAVMREALRRSLNVVTAHWMNVLKPGPVIRIARRMGIASPLPDNLTIGLGSAEVTPLELTAAYAPLANGGFAVTPVPVLKVTDRSGNVLFDHRPARTHVLDPGVAYIVTDMLKEVLRPGGTAAVAGQGLGRPAAGKTGTSDESRDAWFVGYTPDLVASVWVGADDNSPSGREGGGTAAPVWARFIARALSHDPPKDFPRPANVREREICTLTGLLANASCPVSRELFLEGTGPTEVDPTTHWDRLVPELPGLPWSPGLQAPAPAPTPGLPGVPGVPGVPQAFEIPEAP